MTDLPEKNIIISPINVHDPSLFEQIGEEVFRIFRYPVRFCNLLDEIDFAYSTERKQYNSTKILEKLTKNAPKDSLKIVAICERDLYIPVLTHVFGEAQLKGKSCIVSTYRLKDTASLLNPELAFSERVVKEVVHELGHTFNIHHCPDKFCVMHYCRSLNDVDNKNISLCRYCSVFLEDERKRINKIS